jgi:alpha-tubulin suppressor-like RCC1 family protein
VVWATYFSGAGKLAAPVLSDNEKLSFNEMVAPKCSVHDRAIGPINMLKFVNGFCEFVLTFTILLGCCGLVEAATPTVAAGQQHSLGLSIDGKLYGWGADGNGQLGLGRLMLANLPQVVPNFNQGQGTGATSLAAGSTHSVTVKANGSVWAWGDNTDGQLGIGTTISQPSPVPVLGISGAIAVSAGRLHTLALKSDGTVWAWGGNYSGQLGDGTTFGRALPSKVIGLSEVISVKAGGEFSLALTSDGSVWAWGSNSLGQLGNSTIASRSYPARIQGLGKVKAVAAGYEYALALLIDGTLWAWGDNRVGELGDGTFSSRFAPAKVSELVDIKSIAAGLAHSLAIKSDGSVWTWGNNVRGQLCNGATGSQLLPTQVNELRGIVAIAAGSLHTLALGTDGRVFACGENENGQLGSGSTIVHTSPTEVLTNAVSISGGSAHSLASKSDGSIWAWGANSHGELGDGSTMRHSTPSQLTKIGDVKSIAVGWYHSLAITSDGNVRTWGRNSSGQLGDGTTSDRSSPTLLLGLRDVVSIAGGAAHSLAVTSDGSLWVWGSNWEGNLGNGTTVAVSLPEKVQGISGVKAVSAGSLHSLALLSDGTVWAWGDNRYGQLGNGTTLSSLVPAKVPGLTGVVTIKAGGFHNLAIGSHGQLMAWGYNSWGQLGDGTTKNALSPAAVSQVTGVVDVAAGWGHSVALTANGKVYKWGLAANGMNFDAKMSVPQLLPSKVSEITGAISVAAGGIHSIASIFGGGVIAWGGGESGQLGDGTLAEQVAPVRVVNPTVDGFLALEYKVATTPANLNVPFFLSTHGAIADTSADVSTTTKFNPSDKGKTGAVYVTASVPNGSLGTIPLGQSTPTPLIAAGPRPTKNAGTTTNGFTLIQLTPAGWQTVVNGQLIPYASGVFGDQLAAQTILNGTDTTNLKGAEFCVGYGTNAQDMIDNGNIRAVATIPGATTTSSCVVGGTTSIGIDVLPGWNLLGNPVNQTIAVAEKFGDAAKVTSVWKWDATSSKWQVYSPAMTANELQSYVASQGYSVLNEINPGDGYWISAKVQASLGTITGDTINLRQSSLASGWNLVSTASPISARDFNLSLSTTPPTAGQVPINMKSLWAWDSVMAKWYLYAPSLDAQGGTALADYLNSQNYADFASTGKTLGNGVGIWVNRP